jgi:hypothetical protein
MRPQTTRFFACGLRMTLVAQDALACGCQRHAPRPGHVHQDNACQRHREAARKRSNDPFLRSTAIWDQCGSGNPSQTPPLSLECAMEGWRDDWVALPSVWSSTDPGGLHQQPFLVPSLWGGSGPRHPRDAQSPRRVAHTCHEVLITSLLRTSSASVTPHAA